LEENVTTMKLIRQASTSSRVYEGCENNNKLIYCDTVFSTVVSRQLVGIIKRKWNLRLALHYFSFKYSVGWPVSLSILLQLFDYKIGKRTVCRICAVAFQRQACVEINNLVIHYFVNYRITKQYKTRRRLERISWYC